MALEAECVANRNNHAAVYTQVEKGSREAYASKTCVLFLSLEEWCVQMIQ